MKKKTILIAMVLLTLIAVGSVFAETLQCKDPADGSIKVYSMGNQVVATYDGASAQKFNVWVELENGTSEMLTLSFAKIAKATQTRTAYAEAKGRIVKVAHCNVTAY
jgi:hypothetical protein